MKPVAQNGASFASRRRDNLAAESQCNPGPRPHRPAGVGPFHSASSKLQLLHQIGPAWPERNPHPARWAFPGRRCHGIEIKVGQDSVGRLTLQFVSTRDGRQIPRVPGRAGDAAVSQGRRYLKETDGPSNIRMQHLQLQFKDPGFLSSPRSGCFTISSVQGARCSSCNVNGSSHCRLPAMFLTAQAQLLRSKYNSGRGRKLELSKTQERSSYLLSGLAKEAFVEKQQSEGLTIAVGHQTTAACYPRP